MVTKVNDTTSPMECQIIRMNCACNEQSSKNIDIVILLGMFSFVSVEESKK